MNSQITLTEIIKRRMLSGEAIPSRTDDNGDVLIKYDRIVVTMNKGRTHADVFSGKVCVATFDPVNLLAGDTLNITGLEGELRIHFEAK